MENITDFISEGWKDDLGNKEEFEKEKGGWTDEEIAMIEKDTEWQEAHGAYLEEDGSISI